MIKVFLSLVLSIMLSVSAFSMSPTEHAKMTDKVIKAKSVKCIVTGEKIKLTKDILKTTYKGKTYYFCCSDCVKKFKKNPKKYIKVK